MIKAVLLDLDNTLLHNPDKAFASAFLHHFQAHFTQALGLADAGQRFRSAIKNLSQPARHGLVFNTDLIVAEIARGTALSNESIATTLRDFYETTYLQVQGCIQPVAGAAAFIRRLQADGYAVVIATNPLYSLDAVKKRMEWAQLPLEDHLYAFITSADTSHFCKPDPAYYAEILGRVGVEPDEAIMIGDSTRNDIEPARLLGLQTVAITAERPLSHLITHFDELMEAPISALDLKPHMIAPQLRGNIGALFGFLSQVQAGYWHQRPDRNEWSILQVLCHLLTAETQTERPRLQRIAREDNPFIAAPPPPGPDIPICDEDGMRVAQNFAQEREKTLQFIASLPDLAWSRKARHSIFGLTTLLEMAHFSAQHDRLHLNQLCQTIGRCE